MARVPDDHCLLSGYGYNWRIVCMDGLKWIVCRRLDDERYEIILDLSGMNFDAYQDKAASMIARRDAETLEPCP